MIEYKTFDDYIRNVLKIEPTELTHISPEEQKKKTVMITADELINIWNELTELKGAVIRMNNVTTETFGNLTKAKEILKRWVNSYGYIDVALCNQADQFISEVE